MKSVSTIIPKSTRQFYPDELRILKTIKAKREKELNRKNRAHYFFIAAILGLACNYLASITSIDFLCFVFGTITVVCYSFVVFMPFEVYKNKKRLKKFINDLTVFIAKGTVDTYFINSEKIAFAEEYEDEGDLYIIKLDEGKVLYVWDQEYNFKGKFPCLRFEIYEGDFFKLLGRQIYPLSERITPVLIDKNAKWNYMGEIGVGPNLEIQDVNFEALTERFNHCKARK